MRRKKADDIFAFCENIFFNETNKNYEIVNSNRDIKSNKILYDEDDIIYNHIIGFFDRLCKCC